MGASEPGQLHPKKMEGSTVRDWWHTQYRQLSHYLALLFSADCGHTPTDLPLLKDLTQKLNTLNNSYVLLFHKYPTLNLYSPVTTPSERECRPCPEGWESFGERCCLHTQERQNWISSQYHCLSAGGNLAMVKSEEEQIFPWKRAKELSKGDSYWIGLKNGNPGGAGTGWTTPRWKKGQEFLQLLFNLAESPRPLFLLHQTLKLALCIGASRVLLASNKPRFVGLPDGEA
uniref:C-type lectin domain family 1 member A-like n=1 Tax=Oncorhynchus gorbuscha TaxID=8017 RepID=UPI001EAF13A0|nr:C-type lectin domain family 1 member A-like [Oncorhynchus gorbuscha]XP_046218336.1 C-type lectin domain family 1 member A-like [Oncorhynchus gorbuscha]